MIRAALATMLVAVLAACTPAPEPPSDEEVRANNRGVALMGQYRNEEARQIFAALSDAHPDWHAVRVNEIIATLNRQREGDEYRALEMAGEVLAVDPTNLRAAYIAGLMHLYTGEPSSALARFRGVADSAPREAHVAYFTGQALDQLGRHDEALAAYRRAIEADPYLRSAYYGAALALRQLGRADEARAMLDDYQRFAGNPRAHLAEFRYTRMGPLAEAWAVGRGAAASAAAIPDGPLFGEPEVLDRWQAAVPHGAVLVAADFHEGQGPDLLLAAPGATRAWRAAEEGFLPLPDHALAGLGGVQAASWGVPNVGTAFSAFLCRDGENRILERGEQGWAPGPGAEDLADAGRCADSLVFDADHDGDLDWWVANRDGPDELYSNNGDGSWRRLSTAASPALAGDARPTRQLLATDLDGDRDADLVALHDAPPHRVLVNDRLWQYRDAPGAEGFAASEAVAVTV
ncbi:MAG: tetratricopeptide repeat protein, partial [Wenzhouxiangellaceae bacterium]|nr:tetratricopeptide repeat protein [Wenzhouxiangellaceae bacterium]